jgi:1-acyl-sn-glycerol-3-phosphate acyltransferase
MGFLPFDLGFSNDRAQEWEDVPVYTVVKRLVSRPVEDTFDIRTRGLDRIPNEGGAVLAANHASWFDPVFLGAVVDRPVHWMAKADLFRNPLTESFFEKAGQIKVDRISGGNEAAVDESVELARQGRVSGIFPEGSRTIDGSLRRGRTGVARVAVRSGRPVVPVALTSYSVLPKHARVPDLDKPLVIKVGDPMVYQGLEDRVGDVDLYRKITDEIMDEVGRLLEQARTLRDQAAYEASA